MEIKETRHSLTRKFLELVNKYCPDLKRASDSIGSSDAQQFYICLGVVTNPWDKLLEEVGALDSDVELDMKLRVGPPALFENGRWMNLEIAVLDGNYLEKVRQITSEYEQLTGKTTTIFKEY